MERTAEVERLQESGCSVLCLDCPEGMLFGIDYSAWTVGPRFMGVKLVPPGLHYVYTSGSDQDVGVSRTGFFLYMRPKDVAVFRWDAETEELVRPDNQDEEARYADGVRGFDFDANLGPYPLDLSNQWSELTRLASPGLVAKIEPVAKAVRSKRAEYDASALQDKLDKIQPPAESESSEQPKQQQQKQKQEENGDESMGGQQPDPENSQPSQPSVEPRLETNQGTGNLFFSSVPRIRQPKGATPTQTTNLHMDRSDLLSQMISKEYGNDDLGILGELQIAYIAFILGQNYDGFEQWRALLQLLCGSEAAVATRPELFTELCRVFFAQLSQAPGDLFGDDLTKDNFMGSCALSLLEICDAEGSHPKLRKRCGKLRELVQQKFGLSVEDLALVGDDAPQLVEEDGRDLVDLGFRDLGDMD